MFPSKCGCRGRMILYMESYLLLDAQTYPDKRRLKKDRNITSSNMAATTTRPTWGRFCADRLLDEVPGDRDSKNSSVTR